MSISPEHLSDLKLSGLSDDMIEKAGLFSVPPCDIKGILGKAYGDKVNSVLAFPYGQNGFCRFKLFPPIKDKDGHKVKYFQPPGSGVHLYLPAGIEECLSDPSIPLSIVEGEKKALKAVQEGITAIGIGGIWNFKEKGEDGLIADFDNIPLKGRVINLIPDGDYQRNKSVQKAVLTLAEKLKQKGAIPFLISLPDGDEKIGLDDFLVKFGIGEFWEIPHEKIITDPYERLDLPTYLEVANTEARVEWIIDGLIPKESVTLLHSVGGVGKSYLMYLIGFLVAEGETFFGLKTQKTTVHYVDFENPFAEITERVKKVGVSENAKIWHISHPSPPFRIDSEGWEIYKAFPKGLIIFDSLRSSHHGEENSSKDAGFIMDRYREIRSLGNTIILIHHENKLGGYRGSTAWFDLVDHVLKFNRVRKIGSDEEGDENDFNLPIRLTLGGKSRFSSAMELKPLYFKFENHNLCLADDPETDILNKMAELLSPAYPPNQSEFKKLVADNLGFKQKAFNKLVKKGEDSGFWYSKRSRESNKLEYFKNLF